MTDTQTPANDPTNCPICGTPFAATDPATTQRCDHEAGWYREWITEEQTLFAVATDALKSIALGTNDNPTLAARTALAAIRTARDED